MRVSYASKLTVLGWIDASFPRKRESRATGTPPALDPRFRGGDGSVSIPGDQLLEQQKTARAPVHEAQAPQTHRKTVAPPTVAGNCPANLQRKQVASASLL